MTGSAVADDYGWWGDYGQIGRDFAYMKTSGLLEKYLSPDGYKAIPWALYDKGSPDFSKWLYKTMSFADSEVGKLLGDGPEWIEKDHPEMKEAHYKDYTVGSWKWGIAKHHSSESWAQVGALLNLMRNAHAQNHTHINFSSSGLPLALLKEIGAEIFGTRTAVDANNAITPMNQGKAKYAALCMITQDLHETLSPCATGPSRSGYRRAKIRKIPAGATRTPRPSSSLRSPASTKTPRRALAGWSQDSHLVQSADYQEYERSRHASPT